MSSLSRTGSSIDPKADPVNRMEQILHVDTSALLNSLKDLEKQLSDYQKQDSVPVWASSVLPRLEMLEQTYQKTIRDRRDHHHQQQQQQQDISLKNIYEDEELLEKIRHEVEIKTNALKLQFESKTAAAALEVDRLHKLLYIRPTTSELQQVMMEVQNVDKKADAVIGNVANEIHGIVSQKLTEEMTSIMDRLKAAEEHSDKSAAMVETRVADMENEVRKVRAGIKSEFENTVETMGTMKETTSGVITDVTALREHLTQLDGDTKASIDELVNAHDLVVKDFADFEGSANERLEVLEENLTACDEVLREEITRSDERYETVTANIQELLESFEAFKETYAADMEAMRANQEAIEELLNTTIDKQNSILNYVESLQQFELTTKVTRSEESIEALKQGSEILEESINNVQMQVVEVKKEQAEMNEELKDVPNKINVEAVKIEANNKEIGNLKDSLKYTKTMIQDQQNQLEDLALLKEQMSVVKDVCESQDDRIKKILRNVAEVVENGEMQEKRIDEVVNVIAVTEEKMISRIATTKRNIEETVSQQAAETDVKVQELKDSVAVIAAGAGSKSKSGTIISAAPIRSQKDEAAKRVVQMVDAEEQRPGSADMSVSSAAGDRIELIADMCMNFEEIASFRNMVPRDMPSALCGDLAGVAQSLAAVLAETADMEVIQKIIRGDPSDISYDDPVTDKRQVLVDKVMIGLRDKLNELAPSVGAIRLEARDMFVTRFHHALQLAMSKHDQVLATGSTRLGRLKIPSCIACDRPLVSKVQRDSVSTASRAKTPSAAMNAQGSVFSEGPATHSKSFASIGQHGGGYGEGSFFDSSASMDEESSTYPGHSRRRIESVRVPGTNPISDEEARRMAKSNSSGYVLRGGFKMPKPGQPQIPPVGEGRVHLPQMHPS